jgi:hypothetical protein
MFCPGSKGADAIIDENTFISARNDRKTTIKLHNYKSTSTYGKSFFTSIYSTI